MAEPRGTNDARSNHRYLTYRSRRESPGVRGDETVQQGWVEEGGGVVEEGVEEWGVRLEGLSFSQGGWWWGRVARVPTWAE
eukprot:746779-Hanusia_phi.AAC.4